MWRKLSAEEITRFHERDFSNFTHPQVGETWTESPCHVAIATWGPGLDVALSTLYAQRFTEAVLSALDRLAAYDMFHAMDDALMADFYLAYEMYDPLVVVLERSEAACDHVISLSNLRRFNLGKDLARVVVARRAAAEVAAQLL